MISSAGPPDRRPVTRAPKEHQEELPVDAYVNQFATASAIEAERQRDTSLFVHGEIARVWDSVHPHVFDMDAQICGSFATGTQLAKETIDVDVVVRIFDPPATWIEEPRHAYEDLARWLAYDFSEIDASSRTIRLHGEHATIKLVPGWRQDAAFTVPAADGLTAWHIDPIDHRDLVRARDRALGGRFTALIRFIRRLNQKWRIKQGTPPLNSFQIDALALRACTRQFELTEGIADFLAAASELVKQPLEDPTGTKAPFAVDDPVLASSLFASAAQLYEEALMAKEPRSAKKLVSRLLDYEPRDRYLAY